MPIITRSIVTVALTTIVFATCSRGASDSVAPPTSVATGSVVTASGSASSIDPVSPSASESGGGGNGGGGGDQQTDQDGLQVFAYATTDEASLADQVVALGEVVVRLQADAQSRDVAAVKADAADLQEISTKLEKAADSATGRQKPLDPTDDTLTKARSTAIQAFSLTSDYASLAAELAGVAADPSIQTLATIVQEAGSLVGQQDQILSAYDQLNHLLLTWSQAHPAQAAAALAAYGG